MGVGRVTMKHFIDLLNTSIVVPPLNLIWHDHPFFSIFNSSIKIASPQSSPLLLFSHDSRQLTPSFHSSTWLCVNLRPSKSNCTRLRHKQTIGKIPSLHFSVGCPSFGPSICIDSSGCEYARTHNRLSNFFTKEKENDIGLSDLISLVKCY